MKFGFADGPAQKSKVVGKPLAGLIQKPEEMLESTDGSLALPAGSTQ